MDTSEIKERFCLGTQAYFWGRIREKVVPAPWVLSTVIFPRFRWVNRATMMSPIPIPFWPICALSGWLKVSCIICCFSGGIPYNVPQF
jgi:hypothetical protein